MANQEANPQPITAENPVPVGIFNYPGGGKETYLFKKSLTKSDMVKKGLSLIGGGRDVFGNLGEEYDKIMYRGGLSITVHAPNNVEFAAIVNVFSNGYHLIKYEWAAAADKLNYKEGDTIECWSVVYPNESPEKTVRLLIKKV